MRTPQPRPRSLVSCVVFYLEDCEIQGLKPRTVEGKRCALQFFLLWCAAEGLKRPQQIGLAEIEAYKAHLHQYRQPHSGRPLQKPTIRNRLTAVKMLFDCLYRREFVAINKVALMKLPKVPRQLPKAHLELREIEAALQQPKPNNPAGVRDRTLLVTLYAAGIRRMEILGLDLEDVDLEKRIVTVRKGKGDRDRRVPIAPLACGWLKAYLIYARPELQSLESGQALFLDNRGLRFRAHQVTALTKKYVRKAGIDKPTACNLFRHSAATGMHENGADIRVIQEYLGHADISTTQIYTHVAINELRRVYAQTHPAAL